MGNRRIHTAPFGPVDAGAVPTQMITGAFVDGWEDWLDDGDADL